MRWLILALLPLACGATDRDDRAPCADYEAVTIGPGECVAVIGELGGVSTSAVTTACEEPKVLSDCQRYAMPFERGQMTIYVGSEARYARHQIGTQPNWTPAQCECP